MCEENEKKIGISEFVHENLFEQVIWSSFDTDVVWVSTCFDGFFFFLFFDFFFFFFEFCF